MGPKLRSVIIELGKATPDISCKIKFMYRLAFSSLLKSNLVYVGK